MGAIRTSIEIIDGFSPAFKSMNNALNVVMSSLAKTQDALGRPVDTSAIESVQRELAEAALAIEDVGKEAAQAANGQNKLNDEMREGSSVASTLWGKLKTLIGAYSLYQGASTLVTGADTFTNINSRLDLMNDGLQTTAELNNLVWESANRTFSSFKDTADAVGKLGIQAGNAFSNSREIVAFAEQLNKHITIAGTQGAAAQGAMIQMVQAMSNGVLRGEELNSVLDGMPTVAKTIQEEFARMGDTRGIKEIAEEGLITADIVKQALFNAAEETDRKFNEMGMTFGDVWNLFKNHADKALEPVYKRLGEISNSEGFQNLARVAGQAFSIIGYGVAELINGVGHVVEIFKGVFAVIEPYWDNFKQSAIDAFSKIKDTFSRIFNSQIVQTLFTVIGAALVGIVSAATIAFDVVGSIVQFLGDNWAFVEPILWGVVAALGAQAGMALWAKTQMMGAALATAWKTVVDWAETAAIIAMTLAQDGLNAALALCPITWIIGAIIALIVIVYLVVAAINKFADTSISATGIIFGAFAWLAATIWNIVVGLINGVIQFIWTNFVTPFLSIIEWVLNVVNGGFDSFGDAVANLIGNIIGWFLDLGMVVTKIIDAIFGTDWTSGLEALKDKVLSWGKNEKAITIEREVPEELTLDRVNATDWYNNAYQFGDELSNMNPLDSFKNETVPVEEYFNQTVDTGGYGALDLSQYANTNQTNPLTDGVLKGLNGNNFSVDTSNMENSLDAINKNTAATANELSASEEELKYLREIGEREAINKFTTAKIVVDAKSNNTINNGMDIDGFIGTLTAKLRDAMSSAAEGAHA